MATIIPARKGNWDVVRLSDLPVDVRRMLSLQIKELVHEIEDCEDNVMAHTGADVIRIFEELFRAA